MAVPLECADCGHRHGAPGHNPTCKEREQGADAQQKTPNEARAATHVSGPSFLSISREKSNIYRANGFAWGIALRTV